MSMSSIFVPDVHHPLPELLSNYSALKERKVLTFNEDGDAVYKRTSIFII